MHGCNHDIPKETSRNGCVSGHSPFPCPKFSMARASGSRPPCRAGLGELALLVPGGLGPHRRRAQRASRARWEPIASCGKGMGGRDGRGRPSGRNRMAQSWSQKGVGWPNFSGWEWVCFLGSKSHSFPTEPVSICFRPSFLWCILPRDVRTFLFLPTNGFFVLNH